MAPDECSCCSLHRSYRAGKWSPSHSRSHTAPHSPVQESGRVRVRGVGGGGCEGCGRGREDALVVCVCMCVCMCILQCAPLVWQRGHF